MNNGFRRCPQRNDKLYPRKMSLLSLYLFPVKSTIDVPGKVVYLLNYYTTVYCACLSVVLVPAETLPAG